MLRDMWTISKKDIQEVLFSRGNKRSGLISMLVLIGLIGVYFPLVSQDTWLTQPCRGAQLELDADLHGHQHRDRFHRRGTRTPHPGNSAGQPRHRPGHPAGQDRRRGVVRLGHVHHQSAGGRHHGQRCQLGAGRCASIQWDFSWGGNRHEPAAVRLHQAPSACSSP